jgi:hypothetical protein
VDVSLGALMSRLFALRSWDSTGASLNRRIRSALNLALDRLAGDVPEALIPDEQHIALIPDAESATSSVDAYVASYNNDKRLLFFTDSTKSTSIGASGSLTTWRPTITGEWDGVMHLELTYNDGTVLRRQSREWFKDSVVPLNQSPAVDHYFVTLDRPLPGIIADNNAISFRIHQPEVFFSDDVMEVLEPAKIYDSNRGKVWKLDTAGAGRQDMHDFQGDSKGRPYRCWRGRHFQLPAPTEPPQIQQINLKQAKPKGQQGGLTDVNFHTDDIAEILGANDEETTFVEPMAYAVGGGSVSAATMTPLPPGEDNFKWVGTKSLREGTWAICYTYVWGRRDEEWQQSPSVAPLGDQNQDSSYKLTWAYETGTQPSEVAVTTGVHDPVWESAPSPVTVVKQKKLDGTDGALILSATNIDAMLGFGDSTYTRYGRSGLRIRYYVSHRSKHKSGHGEFNGVETGEKFYLLCEIEPTYDHVASMSSAGITIPSGLLTNPGLIKSARVVWNGRQLYDYHRPMKHSTGVLRVESFSPPGCSI